MNPSKGNNYGRVGDTGVALTIYRLRKCGIFAEEAGSGGQPYDVAALYENHLWRVQVKTTTSPEGPSARFLTARGRYANNNSPHHKDLSPYTLDHTDVLALVVLSLERVIFIPALDVKHKTRIPVTKFTNDVELTSFKEAVAKVRAELEV